MAGAIDDGHSECDVFDFDENGAVDVFDCERFVEGVTGPWNPGEEAIEMGK